VAAWPEIFGCLALQSSAGVCKYIVFERCGCCTRSVLSLLTCAIIASCLFTQVVREVIEGVEQLDQQLKRREPADAIKPRLQGLQERLIDLATLMSDMAK
jgi:hypothetical protein